MLEELDRVDWERAEQPSWNRPFVVPDAIRRLADSVSEDDGLRAYHDFLFAIGNNHAGTYFPVVLATLPFLGDIFREGGSVARRMTLDVLVDLTGSFEPEPPCSTLRDVHGRTLSLRQQVLDGVHKLAVVIRGLADDPSVDATARSLASEVLELLVNQNGSPEPGQPFPRADGRELTQPALW